MALAMDLGLAKERLERGDDPAATAELVGQAHDEAKRAITELRELVRGIHPAVLTDRGLDAALSAVAARCPVPVELERRARPPPAGARRGDGLLRGGRGADQRRQAQPRPPSARAGGPARAGARGRGHRRRRRWRGRATGGRPGRAGATASRPSRGPLRLASPAGGPTTLLVELPCGS